MSEVGKFSIDQLTQRKLKFNICLSNLLFCSVRKIFDYNLPEMEQQKVQ